MDNLGDLIYQAYDELRSVVIHAFGFDCDDLTHNELIDLLKNERVLVSVNTVDRSITSEPGLDAIIPEVITWLKD